jgi:hypothetical protein
LRPLAFASPVVTEASHILNLGFENDPIFKALNEKAGRQARKEGRLSKSEDVAVDGILLSASAASASAPAGLRNGVSGLTATAGGGTSAMIGECQPKGGKGYEA